MSIGSWYIIITKLYEQYKMGQHGRDAQEEVQEGAVGAPGLRRPRVKSSPYRFIAEEGIEGDQQADGGMLGSISMNEWITMSIQRAVDNVASRTQDGLAFPRDGGLDRTVHRTLRHGVGHLPRADRHRHRGPGRRSTRSRVRWVRRSS